MEINLGEPIKFQGLFNFEEDELKILAINKPTNQSEKKYRESGSKISYLYQGLNYFRR